MFWCMLDSLLYNSILFDLFAYAYLNDVLTYKQPILHTYNMKNEKE